MLREHEQSAASTKTDWQIVLILFGILICKSVYTAFLGLVPDETYYWDWSRELSFGYFDHPPMIAYLVFLSRKLFGDTALGIRFIMLVCSGSAIFYTYLLTKKMVVKTASLFLLIVLANSVLLFSVGSLIATPDIPLILFWSMALYYGDKALSGSSTSAWFILGACCGLGFLSKYTFALFVIAFVIFIILSKQHRQWLCRWQPYTACALGTLICLPHLFWNAHHQWVSFAFQFTHGVSRKFGVRFDTFGDFIGGQAGLMSLFPFIILCIALWTQAKRILHEPRIAYVYLFFCVPFLTFLVSSLQKKVEANWAAAAYISGFVLIALFYDGLDKVKNKYMSRFISFSVIMTIISTTVVLVHLQIPFLPLAPANDPATQIRGWHEWAQDIDKIRNSVDPAHRIPVCANRYQETSLLGFFCKGHPKATSLCISDRKNGYPYFVDRLKQFSDTVMFVQTSSTPVNTPSYSSVFSVITPVGTVILTQGKQHIPYTVYKGKLQKPL